MEKRCYINDRTNEQTTRASVAVAWRNNGDTIRFYRGYDPINDLPMGYPYFIKGIPQPQPRDENRDHCKRIAEDLEKYVDGVMYTCPDCGEVIEMPESVGDKFKCPCCGLVEDVNEYNQLSIYDYFIDVYDIEYRIGSDRELRSVQIMVACGGPNIYIDTASRAVELYWWTERASYSLLSDTVDAVNAWAEEYYNM